MAQVKGIKGLDKVRSRMNRLVRSVINGSAKQGRLEAERVITAGKKETPVDTGSLRSSGRAADATFSKKSNKYTIDVSFGEGPSGAYALAVHEGLRSRSGTSARSGGSVQTSRRHVSGKSHFLIDPFNRNEKGYFSRHGRKVAQAIKSSLRK